VGPGSPRTLRDPAVDLAVTGYEVWDFDIPAGFRVASIGYETDGEFKARLKNAWRSSDPSPNYCGTTPLASTP
jgi:hypothetical protein